ncbi:MAG: tetratricopeptide repeat protein [Phycisphaerae bacterium]|nr:tetratricopeptide repeat protein [Phycisphaerae bacterium]
MKINTIMITTLLCLTSICIIESGFAEPQVPTVGEAPPMILEKLGDHRRTISTDSEEARKWFDQGFALMTGFNFDGAIASFGQATIYDPNCAMAWWGIAYAAGPNQNNPSMDSPRDEWAYAAAQRAYELKEYETGANRALIEAIVTRYNYPTPEDFTDQHFAYLAAMEAVHEQFPMDPDVTTWTAEAMMVTQPWEYWSLEGQPLKKTPEFRALLESVMRIHPNHPAANHLYIHAMEASPWPEIAEPAADRLVDLIPGSGHLVHMPSHIWIQTGRYDDAADCNRRAAALDDAWFETDPNAGEYRFYMAHNRQFLAWAAMLQGRKREAISSARAIEQEVPAPLLEALGFISDGVAACKWHVLVRFGLWEEILAEPTPPEWAVIGRAIQHYARGVAFANTGRDQEAREELVLFDEAVKNIPVEGWMLGGQPAAEIMPLARFVLVGEIEFKAGNRKKGLDALAEAVAFEHKLVYAEPAPWMMPARHAYGALLIVDGQYQEAEKVYLQDLEVFPANGWALLGLREALIGQERFEEAAITDKAFKLAWKSADVMPPASCYCGSAVASTE